MNLLEQARAAREERDTKNQAYRAERQEANRTQAIQQLASALSRILRVKVEEADTRITVEETSPDEWEPQYTAYIVLDGVKLSGRWRQSSIVGGGGWEVYLHRPCALCGEPSMVLVHDLASLGDELDKEPRHTLTRCPRDQQAAEEEDRVVRRRPPPPTTEERLLDALRDFIDERVPAGAE